MQGRPRIGAPTHAETPNLVVCRRGLRTLVLVNGRRLPIGSPLQGGGADVNQIPGALVVSVQVLTGGASAVYGSDAVAGLVDFRLKDDFEGLRIDYQFSQYGHDNDSSRCRRVVEASDYPVARGNVSDGDMSCVSLVFGGNFDGGRGNATAYATYRDIEPVWQGDRDYSSRALSDDTTFCYGSSTISQGRFTDFGLFGDDTFPCCGPVENGVTVAVRTFDECARSGVTAAQFGDVSHSPAAQYDFLQGGNPGLQPEAADTWSP